MRQQSTSSAECPIARNGPAVTPHSRRSVESIEGVVFLLYFEQGIVISGVKTLLPIRLLRIGLLRVSKWKPIP